MRQARGLVISMLAPLAVLAACSSSSSSSSSSNAFIEQYCSLLRPCCQASTGAGDGSGCVDFYSLFFGGQIDAATSDACLAEIHAHQNEMTFCSKVSSLTPSCQKVFSPKQGTALPGETCHTSSDCAPSTEGTVSCELVTSRPPDPSTPPSSSPAEICQVQIDGKLGDTPCIGTKHDSFISLNDLSPSPGRAFVCDLAKNLWCNSKNHTCEATLKLGDACTFDGGEACGADANCGTGDKCVANPPSTQPTKPPAMDGSLFVVCSTKK